MNLDAVVFIWRHFNIDKIFDRYSRASRKISYTLGFVAGGGGNNGGVAAVSRVIISSLESNCDVLQTTQKTLKQQIT